jgi:DNA-binding IclR family transcriptional regulator
VGCRAPLEALTPQSLTQPADLREELERVRFQAFALDLEECEAGVICVAAAVRNARGETVAAVSNSGPTVRMHAGRAQELSEHVVSTGVQISAQLGYHIPEEPNVGSSGLAGPGK